MSKKMRAYILNFLAITAIFLVINLMIDAKLLSRSNRSMLMDVGIAIIMATSLNLTTGMLGQLALGHAGFMAIGAYTAALVTKHMAVDIALSFPLGLIAGGLMAAAFGIVIGVPALRLKGDYLAIITLGFGEIIRVIINNLPFTGGAMGLIGINRATTFSYVYVVMVLIVISLFTLGRSRHGRAIISIRENEVAAESTGIPTTRYKIFAFTLAAFFAGIAGGLYAHKMGTLSPATFDFNKSIEYLVMVVLGGMGSLTGSIVAATVLTMLPEMLRFLADWRMLIYSIVLILMMLFRPKGLLGTLEFSLVEVWDFCAKYVKMFFAFVKKHMPKREQKVIMPEVPKYDYASFNLPVLETDKLGIRFGGLQAAQDVHIKLYDNEIVGLIGPNGAGKTTVFNLLTGVYQPTEGDITLLGKSIVGKATHEITANGIARTFQNIRLFKSQTAFENVLIGTHLRRTSNMFTASFRLNAKEEKANREKTARLLEIVGLSDVANELATSLPYGKQRRLEIARALATDPTLLLLDEPAAGMNPQETDELGEFIVDIKNKFNLTVFMIEHHMNLVMDISDRIYVLDFGKQIAEGTPEEIQKNPVVIAAYLGVDEE